MIEVVLIPGNEIVNMKRGWYETSKNLVLLLLFQWEVGGVKVWALV